MESFNSLWRTKHTRKGILEVSFLSPAMPHQVPGWETGLPAAGAAEEAGSHDNGGISWDEVTTLTVMVTTSLLASKDSNDMNVLFADDSEYGVDFVARWVDALTKIMRQVPNLESFDMFSFHMLPENPAQIPLLPVRVMVSLLQDVPKLTTLGLFDIDLRGRDKDFAALQRIVLGHCGELEAFTFKRTTIPTERPREAQLPQVVSTFSVAHLSHLHLQGMVLSGACMAVLSKFPHWERLRGLKIDLKMEMASLDCLTEIVDVCPLYQLEVGFFDAGPSPRPQGIDTEISMQKLAEALLGGSKRSLRSLHLILERKLLSKRLMAPWKHVLEYNISCTECTMEAWEAGSGTRCREGNRKELADVEGWAQFGADASKFAELNRKGRGRLLADFCPEEVSSPVTWVNLMHDLCSMEDLHDEDVLTALYAFMLPNSGSISKMACFHSWNF